jgi:hypothetical protein
MVNAEGEIQSEIPVDEPNVDDILDRVTEYFDEPDVKVAELTK